MTPGRVDLKVVGDGLAIIDACVRDLRALPQGSLEEFLGDRRNPPATESLLRRAVQALFDVLRHLLAKSQGRGALEYKELARLAREAGLLQDPHLAAVAFELAGFRNRLVHFYQEVTPEELYGILRDDLGDLEAIAGEIKGAAARFES
jgi:uncharacterized protein YutE (UPF0331/DUF86 family)